MWAEVVSHCRHSDSATSLDCDMRILRFKLGGVLLELLWFKVVEHDDVSPGLRCRQRLFEALAFDFNFLTETARPPSLLHSRLDAPTACPDMIILQHDHLTQVEAVGGRAAHEETILLHEAEARRCLARSRDLALPSSRPGDSDALVRQSGDTAASRH